jgi:hypothetical protein
MVSKVSDTDPIWLSLIRIELAMPLSIPVLNLLVPVIGVAAFTHLFHRLK